VDSEDESYKSSNTESDEESENNFDFRHYPINIDWKLVQESFLEKTDGNYLLLKFKFTNLIITLDKIIKKLGYLGLSLYIRFNSVLKYEKNYFPINFKSDILLYYWRSKKLDNVELFVQKLPKLSEFKTIITKKYYSKCVSNILT